MSLCNVCGSTGHVDADCPATITVSRTINNQRDDYMLFDIRWAGGWIKMEMSLEDFALLITSRSHCPARLRNWRKLIS